MEIMKIFTALMTPLIGCIAIWIAYQQFKTNRASEMRQARSAQLGVYKEIKRLLSYVDSHRDVPDDLYQNFLCAAAEADFLFDESIRDWVSDVESEVDQYLEWNKEFKELKRDQSADGQPDEVIRGVAPEAYDFFTKEMEKNIDALQNFHCELRENFSSQLEHKV